MALASAEERFRLKGEHPPTFLIAAGTDVYWIEESWSSNQERGFKFQLMRAILAQVEARAYSFISEVYVAAMTVAEIERYGMPDELVDMPRDRRDEMLWVDSWDHQGTHYGSTYLITPARPPARQRPFLGPRVEQEYDVMVGRASNLFAPPKDIRR